MATELEDRCAICLDSWEEASFVMPCLHQFCYPCILRWAESKPECPLCKRRILSILHSVQADDDFEENVLTPSVTPSVVVREVGRAPRHPAAHSPHQPGADQRWAAEESPRRSVGDLLPEEWSILFRYHPTLLETLLPWIQLRLRQLFGNNRVEAARVEDTIMAILTNHGMDEELLLHMLEFSLLNHTATFVQQLIHAAVQRCGREAHRLLGRRNAHVAREQEGSPTSASGPAASRGGSPGPGPANAGSPARPITDELPGTSSAATSGGPSSHPSAPVAIPVEQEEPQEEPGEAVPGPSTSSRGTERFPGGPQQPQKRRTDSSEGSPDKKRPAPRL